MRASGVEFAFMRVSDGLKFPDSKFAQNWAGSRAAGVMRGAYQFFRSNEDPVEQANLLIDTMGPLALDDLLQALVRHSLIRRDAEDDSYSVHVLVQEIAGAELTPCDQQEWVERVARATVAACPSGPQFPYWPKWERLLPKP